MEAVTEPANNNEEVKIDKSLKEDKTTSPESADVIPSVIPETNHEEIDDKILEESLKDTLGVDTQDSFSITSNSPELGPSGDELDPEIALFYASNSASELASATVAALELENDSSYEDDSTSAKDLKSHLVNVKQALDQAETLPDQTPDSLQSNNEHKTTSPRSPGVHPLSRETTSEESQAFKGKSKAKNNKSGYFGPVPVIQVNNEINSRLQENKSNRPGLSVDLSPKTLQKKESEIDPGSTPGSSAFMLRNLGAQDWTTSEIKVNNEIGAFCDSYGRTLNFRGVNLAGCSKLPVLTSGRENVQYPDPAFYDHRNVSFVGRPFPLSEAPDHFRRLRVWGLTVIRFLVPWEALEHEGPGIYDQEYIDYIIKILDIANEYGFKVVIDPHQDTWSRFTGGSGAPGWTFEVAGLDMTQFDETAATHIEGMPLIHPSHVPLWSTNYSKLAVCTMFTIFFGGDEFAPGRTYEGVSVQEFLQRHYVQCYRNLADKLKDSPAVIGIEVMNEPSSGYIGLKNLDYYDQNKDLHLGLMPSPLQGMALCDGLIIKIPCYNKSWPWPSKSAGQQVANPNGSRGWLPFTNCIWKEQGVWDVQKGTSYPIALKPEYFYKRVDGYIYDFDRDFYLPFIKKFTNAVRSVHKNLILFVSPVPNQPPPKISIGEIDNFVYAPHWYDLRAIFTKGFDGRMTYDVLALAGGSRNIFAHTYFGLGGARRCYSKQIKTIKDWGKDSLGKVPMWIGELGIPFDINNKLAFTSKDYTIHDQFMDAVLNAVEENFGGVAIWNYNPPNSNSLGDNWNQEDFSIYSQDHPIVTDKLKEIDNPLHRGGRCLGAVARPYASKVAGQSLHTSFDLGTLEFHLEFASVPMSRTRPDGSEYTQEELRMMRQTEIFLPSFHYKRQKLIVDLSDGAWRHVPELQTLYYWYADDRKVEPVAPITDYEDDGMEFESDEDDYDTSSQPASKAPVRQPILRSSSSSNFFSRIRKEFEVRQVDDDDEPEYDPSLVPPNGMVHKIRILVKEYIEDDSW